VVDSCLINSLPLLPPAPVTRIIEKLRLICEFPN
jgi:hypothetical protein